MTEQEDSWLKNQAGSERREKILKTAETVPDKYSKLQLNYSLNCATTVSQLKTLIQKSENTNTKKTITNSFYITAFPL